jgi:hypothetical protein
MSYSHIASWRKVFVLSATFLLALVLGTACKKKENALGLNSLDQNEMLHSAGVDTFSLITFTIEDDSVLTKDPANALLGVYNDPKFGVMNASFYTQLRLSGINPNFGDIATIAVDSIVLGLEYNGFYGDFSPLNLEVFQLSESISRDSTYYAFSTLTHQAQNLIEPGYEVITPRPFGKTVIGADTVDAQMRIRLRNTLAETFINEAATGTAFASNDAFLEYFKGVVVRTSNPNPTSGMGGVYYFNLNDPLSKMTIYYTQDGGQKKYDFVINTNCVDFNHVNIDNSGKPVATVISDTVSGLKEYYAQAFKSRAVVQIPGISSIPKKSIIHKAELYLPVQYQTGTKYAPGFDVSVATRPKDEPNALLSIGVLGTYSDFGKYYKVDLRNYIQTVVSGLAPNNELIFSPRFFITSADRIVFNGPNTTNKVKPKLVITYTEY